MRENAKSARVVVVVRCQTRERLNYENENTSWRAKNATYVYIGTILINSNQRLRVFAFSPLYFI